MLPILLSLVFGYVCGSIPFGLILSRFAGLVDVRDIGSGNIGATNVLRTGNKKVAAATLLCDMLKGAIPVWGMWVIFGYGTNTAPTLAIAAGAFLGHLFPVWLKFKGGKGIATYVGIISGLSVVGLLVFAVVWIFVALATRYSSVAALAATLGAPIAVAMTGVNEAAACLALLSALAWFMHRSNISRLLAGTEGKIGAKE